MRSGVVKRKNTVDTIQAAAGSIDRVIGSSLVIGICNRPRHTEIPNGTGDDLRRKSGTTGAAPFQSDAFDALQD